MKQSVAFVVQRPRDLSCNGRSLHFHFFPVKPIFLRTLSLDFLLSHSSSLSAQLVGGGEQNCHLHINGFFWVLSHSTRKNCGNVETNHCCLQPLWLLGRQHLHESVYRLDSMLLNSKSGPILIFCGKCVIDNLHINDLFTKSSTMPMLKTYENYPKVSKLFAGET